MDDVLRGSLRPLSDPDAVVCLCLLLPKTSDNLTDPLLQQNNNSSIPQTGSSVNSNGGQLLLPNMFQVQFAFSLACAVVHTDDTGSRVQDKRGVPAGSNRGISGKNIINSNNASERTFGPFGFISWDENTDAVIVEGVCSLKDLHSSPALSVTVRSV
eukprot:gene824-870_t